MGRCSPRKKSNKQRAKSNEQRTESNEQRAKSNEQRAKSNEQRAESNKQRAKSKEQQAKSNEQRAKSSALSSGFTDSIIADETCYILLRISSTLILIPQVGRNFILIFLNPNGKLDIHFNISLLSPWKEFLNNDFEQLTNS